MEKFIVYAIFVLLIGGMFYVFAEKKGYNSNAWFLKGTTIAIVTLLVALFARSQINKHKK